MRSSEEVSEVLPRHEDVTEMKMRGGSEILAYLLCANAESLLQTRKLKKATACAEERDWEMS